MEKEKSIDHEILICDCNSLTHQVMFWMCEETDWPHLYIEIHLTHSHNIFHRIWYALKYIFGYKSNYGAWDEFIFSPENERKLKEYLNNSVEVTKLVKNE